MGYESLGKRSYGPCLGACPRINSLFKLEEFSQNKHSHINDIEVYAICEHYFLTILKSLGR